MNIHPLFVHFPIGLLVAYSALEISTYIWPSIRRLAWLFPVKAFLLFVGVLGAFAALITGSIAAELVEGSSFDFVVEVHATFAAATTALYVVIAAAYLNRVFDRNGWFDRIASSNAFLAWGWNAKKYVAHLIMDTWFLPLIAFLAVISMIVTGALGASIVYGPNTDPIVSFIYHLFWAQ